MTSLDFLNKASKSRTYLRLTAILLVILFFLDQYKANGLLKNFEISHLEKIGGGGGGGGDDGKKTSSSPSSSLSSVLAWNRNALSSPRFMTGSWIGNHWVPPFPWRYYSVKELQEFYKHKNVQFVGDSMARRTGHLLYEILNTSSPNADYDTLEDPAIINLNKNKNGATEICTLLPNITAREQKNSICRRWPDFTNNNSSSPTTDTATATKKQPGMYVMHDCLYCAYMQRAFFRDQLEKIRSRDPVNRSMAASYGMDFIVVSMGAWEIRFPHVCDRVPETPVIPLGFELFIDQLYEFQRETGTLVIFRTPGFVDQYGINGSGAQLAKTMTKISMDRIDQYQLQDPGSRLTYVNWNGALEDRSYGAKRIVGDHIAHYGLEPRMALIQMITNRIMEMEQEMPSPSKGAAILPLSAPTEVDIDAANVSMPPKNASMGHI